MSITSLLREELQGFAAYQPGGRRLEMKEGVTQKILLNANENQLGPSPMAVEAMKEACEMVNLYPFSTNQSATTKQVIADFYGVKPSEVVLSCGSTGLISAIFDCFINNGDEVLTCTPSYDSYRSMAKRMGANFKTIPCKDFGYDLEALGDALSPSTKMVVIVNPNNPTGTLIDNDELDRFMEKVSDNTIVVIDEAYFEWIGDPSYASATRFLNSGKHVIVLKTFSKLFGMAGIRFGYGMMDEDIAQILVQLEFTYGTSRVAQAGVQAAFKDVDYMKRSLKNNVDGRTFLTKVLKDAGFDVVESYASFIYFYPHGISAEDLVLELGSYGMMIRQFGDYARVSIGVPWQNEAFKTILEKVMQDRV